MAGTGLAVSRPARGRLLVVAGAVSVAAVLAAACGSGNGAERPEALAEPNTPGSESSGSAPASGDAPEPGDSSVADAERESDGGGSLPAAEGVDDAAAEAAAASGVDPGDSAAAAGGGSDDAVPVDGTDESRDNSAAEDAAPPVEPQVPTAPLTGLLTSDFSLADRRAVAVKVGNTSRQSRPQVGLAAADVVYEVLIEGGKTRFVAVYHSNIPDLIGPVRSARSTDIDLVADLGTPYLVSSGANPGVFRELRRAHNAQKLVDIGAARNDTSYTRVSDRPAPYNFFFEYPRPDDDTPASVQPLFEFGSNPPDTEDAAGVTVVFHQSSGSVVSHIWDAGLGGWVRLHGDALHTATGAFGPSEVAPANVVVISARYRKSSADARSPQAESFGSGDALVLTAGNVYRGRWERTEDRPGFRFTDASGSPVRLSPGSTWVLVANTSGRFPVARATVLTRAQGTEMLAAARAAAEG